MEEGKVDQHVLAEDISSKIKFEFMDHFLVKLLDPVMVDKQITTPVSNEKPTSDENGVEAVNYDSVKTETKTVESSFRKGIVLKLPASFYSDENVRNKIKIGDTVLFPESCGKNFDLLKDSRLVRYYDIIAIEL
ncbi:hypothetical protein [Sharpea azabuensis]|uniref:hypothetical protein n=1 Tax=Sharpea azabuensis TaxID=322505 RepID=UPI0015682D69|nr:hypothetical protein [Sharpea azabuensis]